MKIGRNDPCHCSSGKKYKRCCLNKENDPVPKEVIEHFQKVMAEQKALEDAGIYINYVRPIIFKEKKVWALGNRVYHSRQPNETFHEFIIDIFKLTLGKEWWDEQMKLRDKHFIVNCFLKFYEWQRRNAVTANRVSERIWGATPDGWSKSLLSLAFDVCSLIHTRQLPEYLLKRLKNKNEYQGARYEIAVAAIFARLGCEIHFLDEREKLTSKHCEFIAKHRETGVEVAVEAKSRHRQGIIHVPGIYDEKKSLKGDIGRLLSTALKQNPNDKPFMIFIDINSPLTPKIAMGEKQWFKDIEKTVGRLGAPIKSNPDPYNGIFFTNFSSHYQTEKEADPNEHLAVIPLYSKLPLPNPRFLDMIVSALNHYGSVPNLDLDEADTLSSSVI